MSRRKNNQEQSNKGPDYFESVARTDTQFTRIYESMLKSPAFMDLSKNQRLLYIYMKAQWIGKGRPGAKDEYKNIPEAQGNDKFFFNLATAEKYGITTQANHREFYKDIKALVSHGFIEIIASGKVNRKKSIYKYSDKWKTWKAGQN